MLSLLSRSWSSTMGHLALATPLVAFALPTYAAPKSGVEEMVLSAVSQSIGDVGSVMAYYTVASVEMTKPQAIQQCGDMLATTGQMTSGLAAGLSLLCSQYGLQTCDAANTASSLSQHLTLAGQHIQQANFEQASIEVRGARLKLSQLMTLEGTGVVPEDVREQFQASMSAFDAAADLLMVIGSPSAFSKCFEYVFEQHVPSNPSAMLSSLQDPPVFGWPADLFPYEVIDVDYQAGMWNDGGELATGLALPISQSILTTWQQLGPANVLNTYGFAALASTFNSAGADLQGSMYALRDLFNFGLEVSGACPEECLTDDDCGGCTITKVGVGLEVYNPDEVKTAKLVVDWVLKIDVARRGVHSPTSSKQIRDAVKKAFSTLTDKLLSKSGHLYMYMVANYCEKSWCYLFWWEYKCKVKKEEWVKVPLPASQTLKAVKSWSATDWQTAESAMDSEAAAWCAANG